MIDDPAEGITKVRRHFRTMYRLNAASASCALVAVVLNGFVGTFPLSVVVGGVMGGFVGYGSAKYVKYRRLYRMANRPWE